MQSSLVEVLDARGDAFWPGMCQTVANVLDLWESSYKQKQDLFGAISIVTCASPASGLAQAAAFTSAIWTSV